MKRKALSILIILVLMIGNSSSILAQTNNERVDWLIDRGLVTGDAQGYRLSDPIKRSEVAAMITRSLNAESTAMLLKPVTSKFVDVKLSHWANGYINYVGSSKFVEGYPDNTFKPDANITYAEIIKILVMVNNPDFKPISLTGGYWATPYIIEGIQQGILKDIQIDKSNYNILATREKVFEMIYNTTVKRVMKDQESYKAIALENNRNGKLDSNEVRFALIEVGDNSPEAKLRYRMNDEIDLILPTGFDSESILGMVVDITIDKKNMIVSLTVDESFDYYTGPFVAYDTQIMLNNGEIYDVVDRVRSPRAVEKLYGVYYNDKSMDYMDYVIENDSIDDNIDGAFVAEFAKVTVKDEEVYFIDAFTFSDIAPVKNVKDSGKKITVFTDYPSASESLYYLDSAFGFKDGMFTKINLNEISKDDILHIYKNKAIVKFNANLNGEFQGIRKKDDVYYAKIDGEFFQVRSTNDKRPIYSLDGSAYFTLYDISSNELLKDLDETIVTVLLDLNDHLQLIIGEVSYNEKTVLVKESGTRNIYTMSNDGKEETFRIDNFSVVMKNNATNGSLADFYKGSLAYLSYDKDLVERLVRLAHAQDIISGAKSVSKNSKGKFYIDSENKNIKISEKTFKYNNNTNIFIVNTSSNQVTRLEAITMEDVLIKARVGSELKAFILTNRDFSMMSLGNRAKVGFDNDVIHTIVFTDFNLADRFVEKSIIQLSYDFNPIRNDSLLGMDNKGNRYQYKLSDFAILSQAKARDIVEVALEDDKVIGTKSLIDETSKTYKVTKLNMKDETIRLELGSEEKNLFISPNLLVFGDKKISVDDEIKFALNSDGELETVLVIK